MTHCGETVSTRAKIYLLFVTLLGLSLLPYCLYSVLTQPNPNWIFLAALTVITSCFAVKVKLAGQKGSLTICVSDFFIFASILLFGPAVAAVIGAIEATIASLRVRIKQPYKYLFNIAQVALGAFVVGQVFDRLAGGAITLGETRLADVPGLVAVALLCGLLYFMINSSLVAGAVGLATDQPFARLWWEHFLWISPTFFCNASTAAILFLCYRPMDFVVALAVVPLILGTYYAHRVKLQRQGQSEETAYTGSRLLGLAQLRFFEASLPRQAKAYILAIILAAVPVFFYCAYYSLTQPGMNWLYLAGLTILSTCFPVRMALYKDRMWITLSDIFVFAAMLHFGPQVAVMIAIVEALTFNFRMHVKGAYRRVFNLAQITIVAYLMGQLVELLLERVSLTDATQVGSGLILLGLSLICGLLYFLLTTGFTASAMALSNWRAFVPLWKRSLAWAPVTLGAAAVVSIVLTYLK